MNKIKVKIPLVQAISLYKEGKSTIEIAKMYDCNYTTVYDKLKKAGIPIRKSSAYGLKTELSKPYLIYLYKKKDLSTRDIAKKYKCTCTAVCKLLKYYKIPVKSRSETSKKYKPTKETKNKLRSINTKYKIDKKEFKRLWESRISSLEIANYFNIPKAAIRGIARRYRIKRINGYLEKPLNQYSTSYKSRKEIRYKEWVKSVLLKYNYKCLICGRNYKLEAHHLNSYTKYPNLRYDINNGVCLCQDHHSYKNKISFHRLYGIKNFTEENFFEYWKKLDYLKRLIYFLSPSGSNPSLIKPLAINSLKVPIICLQAPI